MITVVMMIRTCRVLIMMKIKTKWQCINLEKDFLCFFKH